MSTRCTTHFVDDGRTEAIIYRHSDGYPEGAGKGLYEFLAEVSKLNDTRFDDPSYLAAKYVVWLSAKFRHSDNPLDFLSVGVCKEDPCDIEYRYVVDCSIRDKDGLPVVMGINVNTGKTVKIPRK